MRFSTALSWFQGCANIDNQGTEHLKLITRGYYHIGQLCNEAKRQQDHDFLKEGAVELKKLEKIPLATKVATGCRAYIEWAKIESERGNSGEAQRIVKFASEAAKANNFTDEERLANKVLTGIVEKSEASGGGAALDPAVVIKIADALYTGNKYAEAIGAYQRVVAAAPRTPDGLVRYFLPAWMRIGKCYDNLGLLVEAAMAYDAVVDEWVARRIPHTNQESDPNAKTVLDAANAERKAFSELLQKTGDPAIRTRYDKIAAFLINDEDLKKVNSGSGSDLAYTQGRSFFDQALKEKDSNPSGSAWKDLLGQAKPNLQTASQNFNSERQDNAWVYLVRIPVTLEDHKEAVRAADAALRFWDGPEAKKKAAAIPGIADSRKNCLAQVVYWKAFALHEMKQDDEALKQLTGYAARFPAVDPPTYKQLAMGLEVQVLLGQGRIEDADAATTRLIQDYPAYFLLGKIVFQLAKYYEGQEDAVKARIAPIDRDLYGTKEDPSSGILVRVRKAAHDENEMASHIADINNEKAREEIIAATGQDKTERETARKKAEDLAKQVEGELRKLEAVRKDRADLEARGAALQADKAKVSAELVAPRSKAAEKYWQWDQAVQTADKDSEGKKKRSAENVKTFAGLYYNLAKIKPDEHTYWVRAKSLYEDFLAFPEVKAAANSDERKRPHLGRLGEVDYRLALTAQDPKEARALFEQAVDRLQSVLAKHPDNTPLLTGHLAGEYVTLPWTDPAMDRSFKFPVPKLDSVKSFRNYVSDMKDGKVPAPRYVDGDFDKKFREEVLLHFNKAIEDLPDGKVKQIVDSLKTGTFDPVFFAEFANVQKEFLLPLAHAYAQSGTAANATKASSITQALLSGPNKVDDDSADWWEAKTIVLEVHVSTVERALAAGGAAAPEALPSAKQADAMLSTLKHVYPHIGGLERHDQTLKEWLGIQERLRKVLGALSIPETSVDLAAEAAPSAPPAPPTPAPAKPAEPAPMDGGAAATK